MNVRSYFEEKLYATSLFSIKYNGENVPIASNDIGNGKQRNRRVDVIVTYKNKTTIEVQKTEPKQVEVKKPAKNAIQTNKEDTIITFKDTCTVDTTIILPQGSRYIISVCDYKKYKDSINIVEYLTQESILNSDFLTLTTNNEQLVTGGMFDIQMCNSCQLSKPLKFKVPINNNGMLLSPLCGENIDFKKMSLWSMAKNRAWEGSKKIEIVKYNDSLFYQFNITKSGKYNLDYKIDKNNLENVNTKLKVTGNIRLLAVRVFHQQSIFEKKAKKKSNTVPLKLSRCPQNGCDCTMIKAIGINSDGDTLITSNCINSYKKRVMFGKCKLRRGYVFAFGFIPVRRKGIYRKYIIRPSDWVLKSEQEKEKIDKK